MSRLRCPELRKLPKSTKITAIQWRDQTPGALEPLFTLAKYDARQLVDPLHPGATLKKSQFPLILRDDVGIRMLPLGLLLQEERQFPAIPILTWKERVQRAKEAGITGTKYSKMPNIQNSHFRPGEQLYPQRDYNNEVLSSRNATPPPPILDIKLKKAERRVPMSFHVATSKARMGTFRHQRKRLESRLRAALRLIVTKGAFHDHKEGKIGINMDDSGRKWVMQGWAYMFYPTRKINQMPYANLIDLLRQLFTGLNEKAIRMENEWLNKSLLEDKVVKPRTIGNSGPLRNINPKDQPWGLKTSGLSAFIDKRSQIPPESVDLVKNTSPKNQPWRLQIPGLLGFIDKRSQIPQESANLPVQHHKILPLERRRVKGKPRHADEENVPIQTLAGKAPAIWKKQLISGLESLIGSNSKEDSSKDTR